MKYPKKMFNTIYIFLLMIAVILLLGLQSVKDLVMSFLKSYSKKDSMPKESKNARQKYIIKQNNR